MMLSLDFVRERWNVQADEYNQWSELDADEKVVFAIHVTKELCADTCDRVALDVVNMAREHIRAL